MLLSSVSQPDQLVLKLWNLIAGVKKHFWLKIINKYRLRNLIWDTSKSQLQTNTVWITNTSWIPFFVHPFNLWANNSLRHLHSAIYFAKNQQLQTTTQHHLFCSCLQSPAFPSHDDEVITTKCLSNISTGTNPEKNIVRMQGKTWKTWKWWSVGKDIKKLLKHKETLH